MFVHHVYFWLKDKDSSSDRAALITGLEKLRAVQGIVSTHIGVPAGTNRGVIDSSYSVSWLMIFESSEAEAIYQDHPLHHQFIKTCSPLWERVVVYDSINP